jgi:aerobic carbon-monoxide dehydrogenase large subunit
VVKRNIIFDWEIGEKAATEALFAGAAHFTRLTVVNNRIVVSSMEARVAIADYDTGSGRWTPTPRADGS